MTLQIDNPSIFEHPKSVFETTLSAMKEAESGEDAGIVNIDSVESFIASMMWWSRLIGSCLDSLFRGETVPVIPLARLFTDRIDTKVAVWAAAQL